MKKLNYIYQSLTYYQRKGTLTQDDVLKVFVGVIYQMKLLLEKEGREENDIFSFLTDKRLLKLVFEMIFQAIEEMNYILLDPIKEDTTEGISQKIKTIYERYETL